MVNHVYSLLMNETFRETRMLFQPPIHSSYQPRELTPYAARIYAAVFGSEPDYDGKSIVLYRLLSLLHSTEVEPFTLLDDVRHTYRLDVETPQVFSELRSIYSRARIIGDEDQRPVILGQHNADVMGRLTLNYRVTEKEDNFYVKETLWNNRPAVSEEITPDSNGDNHINLQGGQYRLIVPPVSPGTVWLVEGRTIPRVGIAEIAGRVRQVGSDVALLAANPATDTLTVPKTWLNDGTPVELWLAATLLLLARNIETSNRRV